MHEYRAEFFLEIPMKIAALISSGLDSRLAAKTMRNLGFEVIGLHCVFRFDPTADPDMQSRMDRLYARDGIPVVIRDVTRDFFPILLDPKHGFGSEVNPCIDCKIFMYRQARLFMNEIGARFLVTGEVLGQRPMTQNKPALVRIEKESGMDGLVVRPLSARHLPETLPEQKGWIDPKRLFGITGRGRKEQIALAEKFSIAEYEQPAGGCILTTPQFGSRARALFEHRRKSDISVSQFQLLRLGRHFWPNDHLQVIVGRNERDNRILEQYTEGRTVIEPVHIAGPLTLAEPIRNPSDLRIAARITARYCRHQNQPVQMRYTSQSSEGILDVKALSEADVSRWRV